jgi:hypothetical protein
LEALFGHADSSEPGIQLYGSLGNVVRRGANDSFGPNRVDFSSDWRMSGFGQHRKCRGRQCEGALSVTKSRPV